MSEHRPELSVIVVTFRSGDVLPACLAALRDAAPEASELLVVDNSGDDSVADLTGREWPSARVWVNRVNRGFAAAVNQALREARGGAVLLLNPDARLTPSAIRELQAALIVLPNAGIVAPRLVSSSGGVVSGYPFVTLGTTIWRHFRLGRLLPDAQLGRYRRRMLVGGGPFRVDWAQGACLLVRRDVFEQVGELDEDFFFYAEEVDFMRRAADRGWLTYLVPAAVAHHVEGASSGRVVPLKLASHYLSKVVYFEKHRGPTERVMVRAVLLVDLLLRMVYRGYGALRGDPPDARVRLASYVRTARMLLTMPTRTIVRRWRAMGEGTALPPTHADRRGELTRAAS